MKPLSQLLAGIPPSATLAVNDKAKALKAAGHDVISLATSTRPSTSWPQP